jgi:F0F1-type ATP synthase membrane subunit c/vacuolar-type H+-ATPase subunit K
MLGGAFTTQRGAIAGLGTGLLVGSVTNNVGAGIGSGILASQLVRGGKPKRKSKSRKVRKSKSRKVVRKHKSRR